MKVVLILSMALVALVSKSFAAPSMVLLPAYNHEDIDNEKRDTVVEDVDKASNPYQAVEVPDDDEGRQEIVPLVSAFGLRKAKLLELYQHWLPKVPAGEDSSFKAFLDWMKEQEKRENADETDKKDGEKRSSDDTDSLAGPPQKRAICDSRTIANWKRKLGECGINRYKRSAYEEERQINQPQEDTETDKEDEDGEDDDEAQDEEDDDDDDEAQGTQQRRALCNFQNIADWKRKLAECGIRPKIGPIKLQLADETGEDKRSTDEEEPQINQPEVATTFGLTETALENLYMIWLPKVPEGDDTSFPAFVKWMKEQNKDEPEAVGTQQRRAICNSRTIAKWKRKLGECGINQYKRSADEDEPQINQLQVDTNGEESDDDEEEDDDDEEDDEEEVEDRQSVDGTQQRRAICNSRTIAKWRRKLGECGIHPKIQLNKAETGTEPESVDETDEDKRSADEEESQINQPEVATRTQQRRAICNSRTIAKWKRKLGECGINQYKRSADEDEPQINQSQVDTNGEESDDDEEEDDDDDDDEEDDEEEPEDRQYADGTQQRRAICNFKTITKWRRKLRECGVHPKIQLNKAETGTEPESVDETDEDKRSADEEESQINQPEVATNFGLTEAQLGDLYRMWVPTVPAGKDKSFQAFVDWMNKNDDEKDDDAVHAGTHFYRKVIKWTAKILRGGRRKGKREYDAGEQQLTEVQRSIDEEETPINHQEVATEFGVTGAGLEELYRIWIQKVPAEGDTSFQAFVNWLKENDDRPENGRAVRAGARSWNDYAKWGSGSNYFGKKPKKDYISDEQQLAEDQRSIDESQPQVDQQELATITEDKRDFAAWLKKVFAPWKPKKTRGLEEDEASTITEDKRDFFAKLRDAFKPRKPKMTRGFEDFEEDAQQDIISGLQGSLAARDLQPSFKPGPKSAPRDGMHLFEAYRRWLKTVGDGEDKTLQRYFKLYNIQNPRSFENELSDESQLADFERREGEEEEQKIPVKEEEEKIPVKETDSKDTSDTNGGYSCEENSPCNIENIANEQFYFATASTDKFIQCDAWGGCHTLTCEDGLVWDDLIKTCGLRT